GIYPREAERLGAPPGTGGVHPQQAGGSRPALLYFDDARRLLRRIVSGTIRHASSTINTGGWSAWVRRSPAAAGQQPRRSTVSSLNRNLPSDPPIRLGPDGSIRHPNSER